MTPFRTHADDRANPRHHADGFAVRDRAQTHPAAEGGAPNLRMDAAAKVCYDASPYLLDLSWHAAQRRAEIEAAAEARRQRARNVGALRLLLDERIHLRDIRSRTLSVNTAGWSDFPPAGARSLPHAVGIVVSRFFNEHPLADLTVFSLIHLTTLLLVRLVIHPIDSLIRRDGHGIEAHPSFAVRYVRNATRVAPLPAPARAPQPQAAPVVPTPVAVAAALAPATSTASALAAIAPPAFAVNETVAARNTAPRKPAFSFFQRFAQGWQRPAFGLAMAAAASFAVPIGLYGTFTELLESKDVVIEHGVAGAHALHAAVAAGQELDFAAANAEFTAAAERFREARERLGVLGMGVLVAASALPTDHPLASAYPLLTVGREVALGGAVMTRGMDALGSDRTPVEKLRILREHLDAALPHLARASAALEQVSPAALPEDYAALADMARTELPAALATLTELVDAAELVETLLGSEQKMRYLVVFQNDRELRPTGGFIGSFALLDLDRGSVAKIDMPGGGSYDLQGSLRERIIAPHPMRLINPRWEFQDGNWSPDFPSAAERLTWFYAQSGGPTTDGVIAINASLMERILAAVGPIEMPEYDMVISADNFYLETQTEVELNYDREENRPKQFLADLAPRLVERVMEADSATLLALADAFRGAMRTKDVQVWLRDGELQERAGGLGWTGAFPDAAGDFLAIVHTNIAGQKTDKTMEEIVEHATKILPDGSATVTLTIHRTHTGTKGELFSGVRNVDYLRVYAPHGATLLDASGFTAPDPKLMKIPGPDERPDPELAEREAGMRIHRESGTETYDELGRTVFGNWVMTDPGNTSIVSLTYRLPEGTVARRADGFAYALTLVKQSGANPPAFTTRVEYPRTWLPASAEPSRVTDERGAMVWSGTVDADRSFTTTFRPR